MTNKENIQLNEMTSAYFLEPDGNGGFKFPDWMSEGCADDGEVCDQEIATYVRPLEKVLPWENYLRVICDDKGYNTETRIPWEMLEKIVDARREILAQKGKPNE